MPLPTFVNLGWPTNTLFDLKFALKGCKCPKKWKSCHFKRLWRHHDVIIRFFEKCWIWQKKIRKKYSFWLKIHCKMAVNASKSENQLFSEAMTSSWRHSTFFGKNVEFEKKIIRKNSSFWLKIRCKRAVKCPKNWKSAILRGYDVIMTS